MIKDNKNKPPKVVYFAGPLFTAQELIGNVILARAIERASKGRYRVFLPQDQAIQNTHEAATIRQSDLKAVIDADLFLGNFNGPDLDSGTVAEFVTAKFADKPAVLLRTDFRVLTCVTGQAAGASTCGCAAIPFNSVLLGWPRTELVAIDALAYYSTHQFNIQKLAKHVARAAVAALDRVAALPPLFSKNKKKVSYADALAAVLSNRCSVQPSSTSCNPTGVTILGTGPVTNCSQ